MPRHDDHGRDMDEALAEVQRVLGSGLLWVGLALLVVIGIFVYSVRVGRVSGEQVGLLLDKISGKVEVIKESGVRIYNGVTHDFYTIDRTLQTLDMTGENNLKVKTIDGSDVYVDIKVQYRIEPLKAAEILATSGPGDSFKYKWARDYIRSICRDYLGELTTEEFYDTTKRNAKVVMAQQEAQARLGGFGLVIDSIVIPQKPRFYAAYEELIKRKKLADQSVLQEKSKAQAAKQKQQTAIAVETNRKNVTVEQFRGAMEQKLIAAKAEAERVRKQADAYFDRVTIGAQASYYRMQKQAKGILAGKRAEAEGLQALRKALEGRGGRNMVKLEYARGLRGVKVSGRPFTTSSFTERFEHLTGAASKGRGKDK